MIDLNIEPKIEIWDEMPQISPSKITVNVNAPENEIPEEYQKMVDENWAQFTQLNPKAVNKPCFFMQTYQPTREGGRQIGVEQRLFSVNQAFNRDGLRNGRKVSVENGVAGLFTSMLYVLTKDENGEPCVLYGKKKVGPYAFSAVAGGIANDGDLTEDNERIDVAKFFKRLVLSEAGESYFQRVKNMSVVGLVYKDVIPNRGFDLTGIVETDVEAERAVELFRENQQFSKEVIPVRISAQ